MADPNPVTVVVCADVSVTMRGKPIAELNRGLDVFVERLGWLPDPDRESIRLLPAGFDHLGTPQPVAEPRSVVQWVELRARARRDRRPDPLALSTRSEWTKQEGLPKLSPTLAELRAKLPPALKGRPDGYELFVLVCHNRLDPADEPAAPAALTEYYKSRLYRPASVTYSSAFLLALGVGDVVAPADLDPYVPADRRGMRASLRGLMFREALGWVADRAVDMCRSPGQNFELTGGFGVIDVWAESHRRDASQLVAL
jgi:hypothetical protein